MQMDKEIKELTRQRDLFQSHVKNLLQSAGKDRILRLDKDWVPESSGVSNDLHPGTDNTSDNLDRTTSSLSISNEHLSQQPENSDDNCLLDGCPPTFVGPDPCKGWEEMTSGAESEDNCKEVPCIEKREVETDHKTNINTSTPAFKEREGNSSMIEFVDLDAKSSSGHGQPDQVAVQQKTQVLQRTNEPLVDLSEKSNSSSKAEPQSLAATSLDSPPQIDKVNQEIPSHPQFSKLEQNVSPPQFNKLDQKPMSPRQSDEQELKTMSPPQLDELEQVSVTSPARDEREYSTSSVPFPEKLSERKLHIKGRKSSKKYPLVHKMDASAEDLESVMDSDAEDTASVLNFVVRMNERTKPKSVDKDLDNIMVSTYSNTNTF